MQGDAVTKLVEDEIKKSNAFPEANFGLKVGADWPDFVCALLESKSVQGELLSGFLMMSLLNIQEKVPAGPGMAERVTKVSAVYEPPLKFLYLGIQVGKRIAEIERLEQMSS